MTTPIRAGLVPESFLCDLVRDGTRAMKKEHAALIQEGVRPGFADSIDIDEAFCRGHEQENRWDYLLGHEQTRKIVGLEPHTANNHEISTVISKRKRAIEQLAGHLRPGVRIADWFWVASGRVDFLPIEKAHHRLASGGIKFVGTSLLKKHLPATAPMPAERSPSAAAPRVTPSRRSRK